MSDNTDPIISRSKKCIVKIKVIVWVMAVLCVDDKVFLKVLMIVLVDGTIHGDSYIRPIVIVCRLCKWLTL